MTVGAWPPGWSRGRGTPFVLLALVVLAGLYGCTEPEAEVAAAAPSFSASIEVVTWQQELLVHRSEKDEEFATSPTSPMAGTLYLKSEPGDRVFLVQDGKTFDLAYEPVEGAILEVERSDGSWHWRPLAGDAIRLETEAGETDPEILAGPALFIAGDLHLSFYPAVDRVTFIVFDPERPEMTSFRRLDYYPPEPRFAVSARLVEFEEPEEFVMLTSRSLEKTFYRFGVIRFSVGGDEYGLTAFKSALEGDGSESLFVPFRDATSGKETYGAGRFMEVEMPAEQPFLFDFNRAFSPLCNYSSAYNCAIPPRENHLEVAIRAGEKTYPH